MKPIYPWLTYAGAIPFVFCAICLAVNIDVLPFFGDVTYIIRVYGVMIATFLAGAHWGLHLAHERKNVLALLSNLIVITLWLGFFLLSFTSIILLLVAVFVFLLAIDFTLFKRRLLLVDYFKTRCIISLIVLLSLSVSGVLA